MSSPSEIVQHSATLCDPSHPYSPACGSLHTSSLVTTVVSVLSSQSNLLVFDRLAQCNSVAFFSSKLVCVDL